MMASSVKRLILKRFRSIQSDSITLDNPTFLVGRNGSGKSNIVDAFQFLSDIAASPLQAVFDRHGGMAAVRNRPGGRSRPPNFGLGVVFGELNSKVQSGRYAFEIHALPDYDFEVYHEQCVVQTVAGERFWFDRVEDQFKTNMSSVSPSIDPNLLALPLVGGEARIAPVVRMLGGIRTYHIEPARLRDMQDPDGGMSLKQDGSNAASVLQEVGRRGNDVTRIGEILETIVPNTKEVRVAKHGNKLSLEFTQEWGDRHRIRFDAFSMSDGTLRAVGLLLAVFQQPTPSLVVIEEPEATIHPGALGAILDLIHLASQKCQVVVTTHSPEVLDAEWIEPRHLRVVSWSEGATRVATVSDATKRALQEHLMGAGELLRSNSLHAAELFTDEMSQQLSLFEEVG